MEATYRLLLRIRVNPGMGPEFERVWHDNGAAVTSDPACLGQWLWKGDEQDVYYVISDWTSEHGFREFEKSERHLDHRQRLHPLRASGSMTVLRPVATVPAASGEVLR